MRANVSDVAALRAGRREWLGLAVLALPTILIAMDITVLYLALPQLSADLDPSGTQMLWIMDIYGFMIAGFLVTMGSLGDRIGRRRLLMIGGFAFAFASVVAANSTSATMLIGARAALGIAGATLMPSTLSLITNLFRDPRQRGKAIGIWASCFSVGIAIGPLAGGALLASFWWGSVFLLAVPVMAVLLATAPLLLPEYRDHNAGRLDLASVVISMAAILPVVYGIKELAGHGPAPGPVAAVLVGMIFGAVFVRRQRRLTSPLLDPALFAHPPSRAALIVLLTTIFAVSGIYLFVTQYLQLVEGLSPWSAGLWLLPAALSMVAAATLAPILANRFRPILVICLALVVSAVGYLVLTQVDSAGGLPTLVIGFVIVYIGVGPVMALGTDLVVSSAPPERAGSASSVSETSGELGVSLGVAIVGSLGTAWYARQLRARVPEEMSADAAARAGDGLAQALAVTEELPPSVGSELTDLARDAFTSALNVSAVGLAVLVTGVAVMVATMLRSRTS